MSGNSEIEILIYPGWGFGPAYWDIWDAYLEPECKVKKFDPGYYDSREEIQFSGLHNRLNMVMTHSFGLHQCPVDQLKRTDLLVIFNGFIQFHPVATQFKRRSRLVVQQMINKLEDQPHKVLQDFIKNCYHPDPVESTSRQRTIQLNRLLSDLKRLQNEMLNVEILEQVPRVCILHGADDAIVPKAKGRELYEKLKVDSYYYEIQQAGHALPLTHAKKCWSFIKPIIKKYAY